MTHPNIHTYILHKWMYIHKCTYFCQFVCQRMPRTVKSSLTPIHTHTRPSTYRAQNHCHGILYKQLMQLLNVDGNNHNNNNKQCANTANKNTITTTNSCLQHVCCQQTRRCRAPATKEKIALLQIVSSRSRSGGSPITRLSFFFLYIHTYLHMRM